MSGRMDDEGAVAPRRPYDRVLETLNAVAAMTRNLDLDALAADIGKDLASYAHDLASWAENDPPAGASEDICAHPDAVMSPFCSNLNLGLDEASASFAGSMDNAAADLRAALRYWSRAVGDYEFAIAGAETALRNAVAEAREFYRARKSPASTRNLHHYHVMREALANALATYQSSAASAAGTLTAEAGNLLAAHTGFIAATGAGQARRLAEETSAQTAFWESLATAPDTA